MQSRIWLFVFILKLTNAIDCFHDVQQIPVEEDIIYGEEVIYTNSTTQRCVIFRGINNTHKRAIRGIWDAYQLPYECLADGSHCFNYRRDRKMKMYGCCCNTSRCNENDEAIYMFRPEAFNPSFGIKVLKFVRGLLNFVASITVPIWISALGSFSYTKLRKLFRNKDDNLENSDGEKRQLLDLDEAESDQEEKSQMQKTAKLVPIKSRNKIGDDGKSTSRVAGPSTKMELASTPKTTLEKFSKHSLQASTPSSPLATTPEKTDVTQKSERRSPPKGIQQERAEPRVLPNGRVQRVSMNYEDDEWDD